MQYVADPETKQTYKVEDDGERRLLANFTAWIETETMYLDGQNTKTVLTIRGDSPFEKYPPVDVDANDFPNMKWVLQAWGTRAVIVPGQGSKDDLRAQIQLSSRPTRKSIYTHVGWTTIKNQPAYLHAGGAITAAGNDSDVTVHLPHQLRSYKLSTQGDKREAINATLALRDLARPEIMWPLIAATIAPLHGPVDFATHVSGRTGTFKSELTSLFQSHYGAEMDARHLPGSWSSTANALEAEAYKIANAVFAIDDFVPAGTSWQVRQYQKNADQIIRAQGNQQGRSRLSDTSNLQTTYYPRGLIFSTGEDTPQGHSVRGRMLIVELSPGDIDPKRLTQAQQARPQYPRTIGHYVKHLAANPIQIEPRANALREQMLDIGHTRTPSTLARLIASLAEFLSWARQSQAITDQQERKLRSEATASIMEAGRQQKQYLEEADPVDAFLEVIRQVLGQNLAHMRTPNGGIPRNPELLGWTKEQANDDMPTYKSHGRCIGWVDWNRDELWLESNAAYAEIRKHAGQQIQWTKQTLLKRLKEANALTRTDNARERNTVRVTAEGHPRQVLCLSLSQTLQTQEVPSDE